ncbi:MAG: S8 family serine peptidase, partial [Terriglobia bacterium]
VDYTHPDLAGKVINGPDFFNDDLDSFDDHGHGTHVAGLAAAITNNGRGVAGVSWGSRILGLKVLGRYGYGYYGDIAQAIIYAADNGADVINMSLGGGGYSQTLQDAIDYADAAGVVVIAAAGNSGDRTMSYPAGNRHVMGVGATDTDDSKASFSTYNESVDISAPGVSNLSTYPGNRYAWMSGTSMATPHVAGLAALVLADNSSLLPDAVQARIEETSDDLGSAGRDDYYGHGRINVYRALSGSERDTTVPTNPTLSSSSHAVDVWSADGTVDVNWSGASDDASGVAGYSTVWTSSAATVPDESRDVLADETSATSPNLSDGSWYFRLRTVDNSGNWSSAVGAGPFLIDVTAPNKSLGIEATVTESTAIEVSWMPPIDEGGSGLAGYKVERRTGRGSWSQIATATQMEFTDRNLQPSTTYSYRVRAFDTAGNHGSYSDYAVAQTGAEEQQPPERSFGGVERVWGHTVDGTAAAISRAAWTNSKMVIIARNDHFADGLAAAPLAYSCKNLSDVGSPAPLLLTDTARLSLDTRIEIERLGATSVIIVGGEGAVSPSVAQEIGQIPGVLS